MSEDIMLRVTNLSKVYKLYKNKADRLKEAISLIDKPYSQNFYALNDISFEVKRGETVGIIGTNGSGKSTLLKILTGVVSATSGQVEVHGRISALLELGAGFNPEYTGIENIYLHGTMMGFSKKEMEARKQEIINFADIGDYINQPVKNYSSGMFARLAFAVAISVEPEILIVDEALSVGDVFFQSKCFRKFDELCSKGVTILFVSHDMASVRKMCSRVLWIEQGVQQMFGDCNTVCNAYFNEQKRRLNEENEKYLDTLSVAQSEINHEVHSVLRVPAITPSVNSIISEKARILSAYVKNEKGLFTNQIFADETYTIGIVTTYHEDLDNVIVGFTFNSIKGVVCLADNTYSITGENFSVTKDMTLETTFTFKAPRLRTGHYEICPAIAQGVQDNHVILTWLYGVLDVQLERQGFELSEIGIDYHLENKKIHDIELV